MTRTALYALLLAAMFAGAAEAQWSGPTPVNPGTTAVYEFTDSTSPPLLLVRAPYVKVCLAPDITTTGTSVAQVDVGICIGDTTGTAPCPSVLAAATPLTGAPGSASTQNACVDVSGAEAIRITVTTPPTSETARVTVRGY